MSDLFWWTDAQMARLEPFFPKSHALPGRRLHGNLPRGASRASMTGVVAPGKHHFRRIGMETE